MPRGRRPRITEDQLIDELNKLAEKLNEIPRMKDMEAKGDFSPVTYHNRFGSWNKALEKAGLLEKRKIEPEQKEPADEEEIKEEIRDLTALLGYDVNIQSLQSEENGVSDLKLELSERESGRKIETVSRRIKSGRKKIPSEKLINELRKVYRELGRVPKVKDIGEKGKYTYSTYNTRFGSWDEALKAAGIKGKGTVGKTETDENEYELRKKAETEDTREKPEVSSKEEKKSEKEVDRETKVDSSKRDEMLEEVLKLKANLKRVPSKKDLKNKSSYTIPEYEEEFGSFANLIKEMGKVSFNRDSRNY